MDNESYPMEAMTCVPELNSKPDTLRSGSIDGDAPSKSPLKKVKNKFSRMIHRLWMVEIVSSVISFLCLGLLLFVMKLYDHQKLDNMGDLPTTTINILVTLMRTGMILPVGTALAQLQWSWFKTEQQLVDMETFSDATRGPFGSIILLSKMTKRRFWHFASIGAILTVLSLPLEAVVIHALSLQPVGDPLSNVDQNEIGIYRTNRYEWSLPQSGNSMVGDRIPPPSITAAIDQGIAEAASYGDWGRASMQLLAPSCPSLFCFWPVYQSLSITPVCEDVSTYIVSIDEQYSLPSGTGLDEELTLGRELRGINSTVSFQYPDSAWFKKASDIGPLVANVFILTTMMKEPVAMECALFWSVSIYESKTSYGQWNESALTLYATNVDPSSPAHHAAIHPQEGEDITMQPGDNCWINGTHITTSMQETNSTLAEDCTYFITAAAQLGLQNWLSSPIHGLIGSQTNDSNASNSFINVLSIVLTELNSDYSFGLVNFTTPITTYTTRNLERLLFSSLASSITSSIRTLPRGALLGIHTWAQLAAGIMYDSFRFHVLWPLLLFPTLLVVASATFTFAVAVRARDHLWKKSTLPFVFCGLGREMGDYVDMLDEARGIRVKLGRTEGGMMRLVEVKAGEGEGSEEEGGDKDKGKKEIGDLIV